jgi:hypoxanthine phosphoribosyltransferase
MKQEDWIHIEENAIPYNLKHFIIPHHYANDVDSILLPHGIIIDRFFYN